MILIDELNYRLTWTSPIPIVNGVPLTKEELIALHNKRNSIKPFYGLCGSVESKPYGQSKSSSKEVMR